MKIALIYIIINVLTQQTTVVNIKHFNKLSECKTELSSVQRKVSSWNKGMSNKFQRSISYIKCVEEK
jgi:hypothetical protein